MNITDAHTTNNNYFDSLFARAKQNGLLLMESDGTILKISPSFSELFGYTQDELEGMNSMVLFTKEDQLKGLPQVELKNVIQTGESRDNNYMVHKNGSLHWVSGESVLVENEKGGRHILKIIQDIQHQKNTQHLLRSANEFNENILAGIDDVVIVLNKDMKLLKANKAFLKLFRNQPDLDTLDFIELLKPYDEAGELTNSIRNCSFTKTAFQDKELEIQSASGEKKIFSVSCTCMDADCNVLLVVHDITVHRLAERQREDIIGFVAHELRNPLANLVLCNELMAETLKENNLTATREVLSRSRNNIARLNKMIAELYDTTKVGAGQLHLQVSKFNFQEMVKEAIETMENLHPDYKIRLQGKADIIVRSDRHRLIQVITNYLSNGIKYSNGSTEVELSIKVDQQGITVCVMDKGLGISKEQLPFVFNRFFRAEKTKNLEGVGLGLFLCKQIIQAHKGKVWAESEEGKGSMFCFTIPLNSK